MDTSECLGSLSKITYPNARVIVVDNGSRDGQAGVLRAAFPWAEVLETGENLGFTGGNNVGIRHALAAAADYVLCLNNDTVVDPGFLEPLVQALEDRPDAGMAVSKIFFYDHPEEVWYAGAVCHLDLKHLAKYGGPAWHLQEADQDKGETPFETQVATGCALLLRATALSRLGGFDDRFFAYFEDVELSLRAEKLGIKRLVVPASRVWHKESRSTGGPMSPTVTFYLVRNTCLLADLHAPGGGRRYRRSYRSMSLSHARRLATLSDLSDQDMERALAIHDGLQCGSQDRYGRRERDPQFDARVSRSLLRRRKVYRPIVLPLLNFWNRTFMRAYWYLNYHVFRKFHAPRVVSKNAV
jgi:GT2 family glycosyltransferase